MSEIEKAMKEDMRAFNRSVQAVSECSAGLGVTAALMPCGTAVTNVYEAYEAGVKAERERCIAEAFGWWAETEDLETITTNEASEGIRAALQPKSA